MLHWANATTCITNGAFSVGFVSVLCLCSVKLYHGRWHTFYFMAGGTHFILSNLQDFLCRLRPASQAECGYTAADIPNPSGWGGLSSTVPWVGVAGAPHSHTSW